MFAKNRRRALSSSAVAIEYYIKVYDDEGDAKKLEELKAKQTKLAQNDMSVVTELANDMNNELRAANTGAVVAVDGASAVEEQEFLDSG